MPIFQIAFTICQALNPSVCESHDLYIGSKPPTAYECTFKAIIGAQEYIEKTKPFYRLASTYCGKQRTSI